MEPLTTLSVAVVAEAACRICGGTESVFNLSAVRQERSGHTDLTPLAMLGWWLLGTGTLPEALDLPSETASLRLLARSGLLFAAERRAVPLVVDGEHRTVAQILVGFEGSHRLPNVNWQEFDERTSAERLRAITDLESNRRRPPSPLAGQGNRRYPWIDNLGASAALSEPARRRFDGDADQVLFETISNVHRWSGAERALAVASVTRGGAGSHNRLHVVTADDGRGIPAGVELKRQRQRSTLDWRSEIVNLVEGDGDFGSRSGGDLETALVLALVEYAFSSRPVESTQDGHGLHASGVMANRWGRFEVFTCVDEGAGKVVRVSAQGHSFKGEVVYLPGARGTLVHVSMDASPEQERLIREDPAAELFPIPG